MNASLEGVTRTIAGGAGQSAPAELELDISRMKVGPQGLETFHAPILPDDLRLFRDNLFRRVFGTLGALYPERREEVDLALVLILEFLRETMALFYAGAVVHRARLAGLSHLSIPENFVLLRAAAGKVNPVPRQRRTWRLLAQGIPDPLWRRPLRLARNFMVRDEFRRIPLATIDLERSIVTPAVSPLIRRHARTLGERVFLIPARAWFSPLPGETVENAARLSLDPDVREGLLDAVSGAFAEVGTPFTARERSYLGRWLQEISGLCRAYLDRMLASPGRIPMRLWTGTGGIIWMRLLRLACRRLGGEVTGHEHGTASPAESVSLGLWEFEFCDRFVTFTPELAGHYAQAHHHRYRISEPAPEIVAISTLEGNRPDAGQQIPVTSAWIGNRIRRVMYVNTIYIGDAPGFTPVFADAVWVDWQARLMTLLRRAGFEVLLKPHPECPLRPSPGFEALADGVLRERMEDVREQADAFLFDWVQTTTLVQALATDRPIVVVDFGFTTFDPAVEELFRRRCAVVRGWVDESGRARVDEQALMQAFEEACGKTQDREFYLRYQGGMPGV